MTSSPFDMFDNTSLDVLDDPFEVIEESESDKYYRIMRQTSTFRNTMDIIKFFLCIGVIIIDIYLIVIISRNKKLKETRTNKYVMHYAIFNILQFVSLPFFEFTIEIFGLWRFFSWHVYCLFGQMQDVYIVGMFLCCLALTSEWIITVYYNPNVRRVILSKILNYSILFIYCICFQFWILNVILCYYSIYVITILLNSILYFCLVIFVLVCNCLKIKVKNPSNKKMYSLTIATVMILTWLPLYIYHFCAGFFDAYTFRLFILLTFFIPEYLAYGSPIIVIVLLAKLNKYYKVAFTKTCNKSVQEYTGDDEYFDESENEVKENVNSLASHATLL
ncbi:unnamed protein product [Psylliodes chrysocephalus]|uniref:G-protein coupled receptors family 1 profile domain-containing protein n=1 Tax=Psylliodes chrysocephalus TaxID=3402493 RepID=A0A9P0GMW4_9CUCU|nr:unnamed protein product [Psylliodes chrysocephala]